MSTREPLLWAKHIDAGVRPAQKLGTSAVSLLLGIRPCSGPLKLISKQNRKRAAPIDPKFNGVGGRRINGQ